MPRPCNRKNRRWSRRNCSTRTNAIMRKSSTVKRKMRKDGVTIMSGEQATDECPVRKGFAPERRKLPLVLGYTPLHGDEGVNARQTSTAKSGTALSFWSPVSRMGDSRE